MFISLDFFPLGNSASPNGSNPSSDNRPHNKQPSEIRVIAYCALAGGQGGSLRAPAAPESNLGQIARALHRIHLDCARIVNARSLARGAGMSLSTFHANFKAATANPPLRYLQTICLHNAQLLMVSGVPVAEAARRVGDESPSQFSREFKRLFGRTPKRIANRTYVVLSMS
jgi:AraC-like DNA-binding protein